MRPAGHDPHRAAGASRSGRARRGPPRPRRRWAPRRWPWRGQQAGRRLGAAQPVPRRRPRLDGRL